VRAIGSVRRVPRLRSLHAAIQYVIVGIMFGSADIAAMPRRIFATVLYISVTDVTIGIVIESESKGGGMAVGSTLLLVHLHSKLLNALAAMRVRTRSWKDRTII